MRPILPILVFGFALSAAVSGCSLLLSFDPDGQPCDLNGGCSPGYGCGVDKRCRRGLDAGIQECRCQPGERCSQVTKRCLPNTCQFWRCGAGQYCSDMTGIPTCRDVLLPSLGHLCGNDAECSSEGPNRVCYRGSVQINSGGGTLRTGVCVETCPVAGASCLTSGAVPKTFSLGADGGSACLCIPEGLLTGCATDLACKEDGLVCTIFDHPAIGPSSLCDTPLSSGAGVGEACVLNTQDGGNLCANGLCTPRQPTVEQRTECGELCELRSGGSTCSGGGRCVLSEFSVRGVIRHVPLCVNPGSVCRDCLLDAGNCGPDAPRCTSLGNEMRCLSGCSPDAGPFPSCPSGFNCVLQGEDYRCLPFAGSCF